MNALINHYLVTIKFYPGRIEVTFFSTIDEAQDFYNKLPDYLEKTLSEMILSNQSNFIIKR